MQITQDLSLQKHSTIMKSDPFVLFVLFVCAPCSALKISLHTSEHQGVTEGGVCYSLVAQSGPFRVALRHSELFC